MPNIYKSCYLLHFMVHRLWVVFAVLLGFLMHRCMQNSSLRLLAVSLSDVKIKAETRALKLGCIQHNWHFGLVTLFWLLQWRSQSGLATSPWFFTFPAWPVQQLNTIYVLVLLKVFSMRYNSDSSTAVWVMQILTRGMPRSLCSLWALFLRGRELEAVF